MNDFIKLVTRNNCKGVVHRIFIKTYKKFSFKKFCFLKNRIFHSMSNLALIVATRASINISLVCNNSNITQHFVV